METPLFPLETVVFPGGLLPLRIFEPRYVDMVSSCMQHGQGFGVCALSEGYEAGGPPQDAKIHKIGTLVKIIDFEMLEDGLLGITALGEQKFRVLDTKLQADNLLLGNLKLLTPEPKASLGSKYRHLAEMLERVFPELELVYGMDKMQYLNPDYSDASWVSARLTELLPIELGIKQMFLEYDNSTQRLDSLLQIVNRTQLV